MRSACTATGPRAWLQAEVIRALMQARCRLPSTTPLYHSRPWSRAFTTAEDGEPSSPLRRSRVSGWLTGAPATTQELKQELLAFAAAAGPRSRVIAGVTVEPLSEDVMYPPSFSSDVPAVLSGKKVLSAAGDQLSFACTGCGACCRGFADTVMVDPHDLHRMMSVIPRAGAGASTVGCGGSTATPAGEVVLVSATDFLTTHSSFFQQAIGHFDISALPADTCLPHVAPHGVATWSMSSEGERAGVLRSFGTEGSCAPTGSNPRLPLVSVEPADTPYEFIDELPSTPHAAADAASDSGRHNTGTGDVGDNMHARVQNWGVAPIMFLRSKPSGEGRGRKSRQPDWATTQTQGAHKRGKESTPGLQLSTQPFIVVDNDSDRVCSFALPGKRQGVNGANGPGLTCSLGPVGMPGACSLYPLGELWTSGPIKPVFAAHSPLTVSQDTGMHVDLRASTQLPVRPDSPTQVATGDDTTSRHHFYTIDALRCEGVSHPQLPPLAPGAVARNNILPPTHEAGSTDVSTIASYRAHPTRSLDYRREQTNWFKRLATATAVLQYDQRLAAAMDTLRYTLAEGLCTPHALASRAASGHTPWQCPIAPADVSAHMVNLPPDVRLAFRDALLHPRIALLWARLSSSAESETGTQSLCADDAAALVQHMYRWAWYGWSTSLPAVRTTYTPYNEAEWGRLRTDIEQRTRHCVAILDTLCSALTAAAVAVEQHVIQSRQASKLGRSNGSVDAPVDTESRMGRVRGGRRVRTPTATTGSRSRSAEHTPRRLVAVHSANSASSILAAACQHMLRE